MSTAAAAATTDTTELTPAHELVYELRVREVMTTNVATVSPDTTMVDLMELLRVRRITGVPVMQERRLVGIVSLEDLIKALDEQRRYDRVGTRMSRNVMSVRADDLAVQAVKLFAQYGYGRLPVLDNDGQLVGIVTGNDITRGLVRALGQRYQAEEIRRYRASHIFEDIVSDQTSLVLRYQVFPLDFERGGQASSKLKRALDRLGANPRLLRRVTVSAYEAEMNLVIHARHGGELRADIDPQQITLITADDGPGIQDVDSAFTAGFTTAPDWVRELGFGAGMGLTNIKRYADDVDLQSSAGEGTRLVMRFDVGVAPLNEPTRTLTRSESPPVYGRPSAGSVQEIWRVNDASG